MCSSSGISRLRLRGGRASKSRLLGHFDETFIPLNRVWFALVPRGWVGRESIILPFNATRLDMSAKGQTQKNSLKANVFRIAPESGPCSMQSARLKGAKSRLRQTTNGSEPNASPDQSLSLSRTHVRLKNGSARPVQTEIGEPGFARDHEHQIARGWPQRRGQRYSSTLTDPQGLKVWSERPCKHPSCFWA